MKHLFLHIGYPKTGTTTLQNFLFPHHPELHYLNNEIHESNVITQICYARENHFKRNIEKYASVLERATLDSSLKFVYSNESLTSFSLFFRSYPNPYIWTVDPNNIARKLKWFFIDTKIFDTVSIIITIRKPDDLIKSIYAQVYNLVYKRFKVTNTFEKFCNYVFKNDEIGNIKDTLHYYDIVKTYEQLFGKENLLILVFEEFRLNDLAYITKLARFMNIDEKIAYRLIQNKKINVKSNQNNLYKTDKRSVKYYLAYHKNKLFGNTSFGLSKLGIIRNMDKILVPGKKINVNLDKNIKQIIGIEYKENLIKLNEEYNLKLEKYGYFNG
jgi:hypothetical protein